MRRPWGLRLRVLAAAGTIAVVAAVTFGLLLNALLAQNRAAVPARAVTEARNAIGDVQRLAQDLETGARGYLLTGDDTFLGPYESARQELPPVVDKLARVRREGVQRARIVVLREQLAAYMSNLATVVAARDDSPEVRRACAGASTRSAARSARSTAPSARSCCSAAPRAPSCGSARSSPRASASACCSR